jgi:hypothetical protein
MGRENRDVLGWKRLSGMTLDFMPELAYKRPAHAFRQGMEARHPRASPRRQ